MVIGCQRPGVARLQVARTPHSCGGQAIGDRFASMRRVVDMKSWWHIRYAARVRLQERREGAGGRALQMATSAGRGGIGWRIGYGLRSITGSVVGEESSGSDSGQSPPQATPGREVQHA